MFPNPHTHRGHALSVPPEAEVEVAESVPGEAVRPALQHHGGRLVELHHAAQHGAEDGLVTLVIDTLLQRHVDRVVPPGTRACEIKLYYNN